MCDYFYTQKKIQMHHYKSTLTTHILMSNRVDHKIQQNLDDLPVVSTLILVFSLHRISERYESFEYLVSSKHYKSKEEEDEARKRLVSKGNDVYFAVAICGFIGTVIPIMNRMYHRFRPASTRVSPVIRFNAALAKASVVFGVGLCLFTLALDTKNKPMAIATVGVMVAFGVLVAWYRHEISKFSTSL